MGEINVLDIQVANLIAAGEVVDRPASAVKELIENAMDAGSTKITVEIKKGGISFIRVCDNGKGMSEEELLHITEPFYRTDKSRSRAEGGAGLGLALCKNIAEAHGAKLRFESKIGKGTKVFFDFTT